MVTEKTAQKREAAVMNAMKPQFEKVGRGLDYVEKLLQSQNESNKAWQKAAEELIAAEREIQTECEKTHYEVEAELCSSQGKLQETQRQMNAQLNDAFSAMRIACDHCGTLMSPIQIACHKCGRISTVFPYEDGEDKMLRENAVAELRILEETLRQPARVTSTCEAAQENIDHMVRVSLIAQAYQRLERSNTRKEVFARIQAIADQFVEENSDRHIEVAVVGDVKAGKSTLINALLGERMASTNSTPETSTLVKYRTTKNKNYLRVKFYSRQQWQNLWDSTEPSFKTKFQERKADLIKDKYVGRSEMYAEYASLQELQTEIMHWTCSNSRKHYFVSELEVGYCGKLFPHDVVLVDTPGLEDPVRYRSEITKQYIRNANWVIACVPGIENNMCGASTYEFLNMVRSNLQHDTERMIVVATMADMLTQKKRANLQEHLISQLSESTGCKTGVLCDHFVYASPLIHLLFSEWLAGKLDEEDDDTFGVLADSMRKFGFKGSVYELSSHPKDFLGKLGVEFLLEKLERMVFKSRREQLVKLISADFEKANGIIRSLARQSLLEESDHLLQLKLESKDYYDQCEDLSATVSKLETSKKDIQSLLEQLQQA